MLKRDITYTNPFTEEEVTEEHYFHISKADLVEMEMEEHKAKYKAKDGTELTGMQAKLQRIIEAQDGRAIIAELKDMILRSYGRRDGDRFIKNAKEREDFASSEAFSQFLFELCTDADKAAEFTSNIVPSNLEQEAARISAEAQLAQGGSAEELHDTAIAAVERAGDALGAPREPAAEEVPGTDEWAAKRKPVIAAATPDNPVDINRDDVTLMIPDDLQIGLADGRYKLS